jgi:EpsI family protein
VHRFFSCTRYIISLRVCIYLFAGLITNAWELKLYNFWDALTRQRTDGALVRLITPVYPNEDVPQAEARLTAFTREIVPVLNEFLPK